MNMEFLRKLPTPQEVKQLYPINEQLKEIKQKNDEEIQKIFTGESDKLLLVIGPCSADREDAVIDYIKRLRVVQDKVFDRIIIVPRIYTNKPRTTGAGYKGMLHQPNPLEDPDMLKGIILMLLYSIGLGIPFIISAIFIEKLKTLFDVIKKNYGIIKKVSGLILIVMGFYMFF